MKEKDSTSFSWSREILEGKDDFDAALNSFLNKYPGIKHDNHETQQELLLLIKSHVKLLNTISTAIGKAHQEHDFFYNPDVCLDCLTSVENYLPKSLQTVDLIKNIATKHGLPSYSTNENSFFTLQKLINTFATSQSKAHLLNEFKQRSIPVEGFTKKFKKMKGNYLRLQLYVGIPLLALTCIIIFYGEIFLNAPFSGIQLIFTKAMIALSISIVGSSLIEGNVTTKWTLAKGLTIRAMGWVAVFLLLYFMNPANPGEVY